MKLSRTEKETIILFNEEEQTASVFTCNAALLRKLERLRAKWPELVKIVDEYQDGSKTYLIPKKYVRVTTPQKLTDKQREKRAETLRRNKGVMTDEKVSANGETARETVCNGNGAW